MSDWKQTCFASPGRTLRVLPAFAAILRRLKLPHQPQNRRLIGAPAAVPTSANPRRSGNIKILDSSAEIRSQVPSQGMEINLNLIHI